MLPNIPEAKEYQPCTFNDIRKNKTVIFSEAEYESLKKEYKLLEGKNCIVDRFLRLDSCFKPFKSINESEE